MKRTFSIRFELEPIEVILPWRTNDRGAELHWFGLTSGHYWMETPLGEVLRYTADRQRIWNLASPYVDYSVARLFEDMQEVLPFVLERVPHDIAEIVTNAAWYAKAVEWLESGEQPDEKLDLWYGANEWWGDRHVDTAYLTDGPDFHFWCIDNQVFIRWEQSSDGVWEIPSGQFAVAAPEFQSVAYGFLDEVISQMQQRVDTIEANGWKRADCSLDLPALIREQQQRTAWVSDLKQRKATTDWALVRSFLEQLQEELR